MRWGGVVSQRSYGHAHVALRLRVGVGAVLALALALLPSVTLALTYTPSNGRAVFSTGSASTAPSSEPYTASSNTLGGAVQLPAGAANQASFVLKASPTKSE